MPQQGGIAGKTRVGAQYRNRFIGFRLALRLRVGIRQVVPGRRFRGFGQGILEQSGHYHAGKLFPLQKELQPHVVALSNVENQLGQGKIDPRLCVELLASRYGPAAARRVYRLAVLRNAEMERRFPRNGVGSHGQL